MRRGRDSWSTVLTPSQRGPRHPDPHSPTPEPPEPRLGVNVNAMFAATRWVAGWRDSWGRVPEAASSEPGCGRCGAEGPRGTGRAEPPGGRQDRCPGRQPHERKLRLSTGDCRVFSRLRLTLDPPGGQAASFPEAATAGPRRTRVDAGFGLCEPCRPAVSPARPPAPRGIRQPHGSRSLVAGRVRRAQRRQRMPDHLEPGPQIPELF